MNKVVTDVITSYKYRTEKIIKDQQTALIPALDTSMIEGRVFEYLYDSKRTIVNPDNTICYRCRYLPLKDMHHKKHIAYDVSDCSIHELVYDNIIYPFLVFANGFMIPWSAIRIVCSHENYYLCIGFLNEFWRDLLRADPKIEILRLSDGFVYVDYPVGPADNKVFGFDINGTLSDDDFCPISIMNENTSIIKCSSYTTNTAVNAFEVETDKSVKLYPESVTVFKNDMFYGDADVQVVGHLLTIDNGLNENSDKLDFFVFKNAKAVSTVDNIAKTKTATVAPFVQEQNQGKTVPEYITKLELPFEFEMSRKKDYATNLAESLHYIMNYNTSLFEDAYLKDKNLTVEEKTGQWVLDNVGEDGCLRISINHRKLDEEYIIFLVNGILYKYYYTISYDDGHCIIPIKDINAEDTIELMRFSGVNNNSFDIVINKDDPYFPYDEDYINNTIKLFSTIPPTNDFEFPASGLQHFPIGYTLDKDEDGKIKIILTDERYYGKPLKLVYTNQYHHYWFDIVQVENSDTYCIDLGTKFMYCDDYSRYLVFFNGRRLSTDQYRLCLPVRSTTPFSRFELYLTQAVEEGDRVDVIYTPSLLKDVILLPEIESDGNIVVDKSKITYSLDKSLYMVWMNGKKIPMSSISNIDSSKIRITTDTQTTQTVSVTKFLPDIDDLTTEFQNSNAIWDQITKDLTDDEIKALLDFENIELTNTEKDIYENNIPVRAVMLELIREKYIMNAGVDTTKPFIYDYQDVDTTAIDGYDSGNNAILSAADANIAENIDGIEREWP